ERVQVSRESVAGAPLKADTDDALTDDCLTAALHGREGRERQHLSFHRDGHAVIARRLETEIALVERPGFGAGRGANCGERGIPSAADDETALDVAVVEGQDLCVERRNLIEQQGEAPRGARRRQAAPGPLTDAACRHLVSIPGNPDLPGEASDLRKALWF